jgi:hypothetical protein
LLDKLAGLLGLGGLEKPSVINMFDILLEMLEMLGGLLLSIENEAVENAQTNQKCVHA